MTDILNQPTVLRLNGNFMRLGWTTPAVAFGMLMGQSRDGAPPAVAIDVAYEEDEFGMPVLEKGVWSTVTWDDWLKLNVRKGDLDKVIHTAKRVIRVPTTIVCSHFKIMPQKDQKLSSAAIRRRDGNRCQYTGKLLKNSEGSLDHIIPRSKGGKNNWENLVWASKEVNSMKGDKFNHEVGLKLLKRPTAPKKIALCTLYPEIKHPDHAHF